MIRLAHHVKRAIDSGPKKLVFLVGTAQEYGPRTITFFSSPAMPANSRCSVGAAIEPRATVPTNTA